MKVLRTKGNDYKNSKRFPIKNDPILESYQTVDKLVGNKSKNIQSISEIRSLSVDRLPSRIKASSCGVVVGRSITNFYNQGGFHKTIKKHIE
ncbi:hypothetical protein ABES21_18805 [Peribacillus frigoritolerans]|uniref:hypothetical protein n=1 Tax=Peribacillus frigoritolerans TaxID=450367 RepID=UPI003D2C489B